MPRCRFIGQRTKREQGSGSPCGKFTFRVPDTQFLGECRNSRLVVPEPRFVDVNFFNRGRRQVNL